MLLNAPYQLKIIQKMIPKGHNNTVSGVIVA